MIEVGKKYCPVCVANNGWGRDPLGYQTDPINKDILPCRYPWQTPIGVLNADVRQVGDTKPVEVMSKGTFELYWNNDDDSGTEPDIFGCGKFTSLIGVRVYYDARHSIYVAENATNVDTVGVEDREDWIGTFPGSATVGYILAVRPDPDYDDAGWVTITIDPRPAKSKYRVTTVTSYLEDELMIGVPITIEPNNHARVYDPDSYVTCDGVFAGYFEVRRGEIEPPEVSTAAITCTSGPAWILATREQLYSICDHTILETYGYPPCRGVINVNKAFQVYGTATTPYAPRLGYACLKKWYWSSDQTEKMLLILDVDPDLPTVLEPKTQKEGDQT